MYSVLSPAALGQLFAKYNYVPKPGGDQIGIFVFVSWFGFFFFCFVFLSLHLFSDTSVKSRVFHFNEKDDLPILLFSKKDPKLTNHHHQQNLLQLLLKMFNLNVLPKRTAFYCIFT